MDRWSFFICIGSEEYLEKLKNAVEKKLGCPIEIKEIKKNNGYTYRGLVVHDGASIKPVIAVQGRRG